jgi:putative cell wall-binding protein
MPGKDKYEETHNSPFRELIQKADNLINNARSFLVIGFGFNDKHLTPKIKEKIKDGTNLVLITKNVSDSCKEELKIGNNCIYIEEECGKTKVTKKIKGNKMESTIDGNYWQLNHFVL